MQPGKARLAGVAKARSDSPERGRRVVAGSFYAFGIHQARPRDQLQMKFFPKKSLHPVRECRHRCPI